MRQVYFTIPLAIAYWVFIPTEGMGTDAMIGYLMFGAALSIGALSDLDRRNK